MNTSFVFLFSLLFSFWGWKCSGGLFLGGGGGRESMTRESFMDLCGEKSTSVDVLVVKSWG